MVNIKEIKKARLPVGERFIIETLEKLKLVRFNDANYLCLPNDNILFEIWDTSFFVYSGLYQYIEIVTDLTYDNVIILISKYIKILFDIEVKSNRLLTFNSKYKTSQIFIPE